MRSVFDAAEFMLVCQLYKKLQPIASRIRQLAEGVENTMKELASDTMVQALEIYSAAKANRSKVPGLDVTAEELAIFFAESRR